MRNLSVHGWNTGFQKVEFTKMLQRELGYTLSLAKDATDSIVERHKVELAIEDEKHERVSKLATELGAIVSA